MIVLSVCLTNTKSVFPCLVNGRCAKSIYQPKQVSCDRRCMHCMDCVRWCRPPFINMETATFTYMPCKPCQKGELHLRKRSCVWMCVKMCRSCCVIFAELICYEHLLHRLLLIIVLIARKATNWLWVSGYFHWPWHKNSLWFWPWVQWGRR